MPDDLTEAAELTARAIDALDRVGGQADVPAALLDHGLKLIEQLVAEQATSAEAR